MPPPAAPVISTASSCACISAIFCLHLLRLLHQLADILHGSSSPAFALVVARTHRRFRLGRVGLGARPPRTAPAPPRSSPPERSPAPPEPTGAPPPRSAARCPAAPACCCQGRRALGLRDTATTQRIPVHSPSSWPRRLASRAAQPRPGGTRSGPARNATRWHMRDQDASAAAPRAACRTARRPRRSFAAADRAQARRRNRAARRLVLRRERGREQLSGACGEAWRAPDGAGRVRVGAVVAAPSPVRHGPLARPSPPPWRRDGATAAARGCAPLPEPYCPFRVAARPAPARPAPAGRRHRRGASAPSRRPAPATGAACTSSMPFSSICQARASTGIDSVSASGRARSRSPSSSGSPAPALGRQLQPGHEMRQIEQILQHHQRIGAALIERVHLRRARRRRRRAARVSNRSKTRPRSAMPSMSRTAACVDRAAVGTSAIA